MTAAPALREATADDQAFMTARLNDALFVPPGEAPFEPDIVDSPGVVEYHAGFGTWPGDTGMIAVIDDEPVGAVWVRLLRGYGFVDACTPELTIAVVEEHRGRGIGEALLTSLFAGVVRCSLSCDRRNPAIRLYERHGFAIVATDGEHSVTMLRDRRE